MKIYLTTRYTTSGSVLWQRISFKKGQYAGGLGAAKSDARSKSTYYLHRGGRVTLHVADIPDDAWELLADENSPTGTIDIPVGN